MYAKPKQTALKPTAQFEYIAFYLNAVFQTDLPRAFLESEHLQRKITSNQTIKRVANRTGLASL